MVLVQGHLFSLQNTPNGYENTIEAQGFRPWVVVNQTI
jgi:hypothetical protein